MPQQSGEPGVMTAVKRLICILRQHKYRVVRKMNPGARQLICDRCGQRFGMHDATRTVVPWDSELEAAYAPGGPLDPATYKG